MAVLTLTRDGPVATLTLQRPTVHNAFNPEMIAGITEICTEIWLIRCSACSLYKVRDSHFAPAPI